MFCRMFCSSHSTQSSNLLPRPTTLVKMPSIKSLLVPLLLNLLIQPSHGSSHGGPPPPHHNPHHPPKGIFNIPKGASARVSIIDTTARLHGSQPKDLMTPYIPGFDLFPPIPSYSFLVESSNGKKALFDLGGPPNKNESFSPAINRLLQSVPWRFEADKHVVDILREHRVNPSSINSIIWSHSHFDHIGDPSTFPHSTDLVVGPGWKNAFLPGYPTNPDALVMDAYFA